jgi:hypothetical protein
MMIVVDLFVLFNWSALARCFFQPQIGAHPSSLLPEFQGAFI